MSLFAESWQDSQFWYKDETATVLAEQLLEGVTAESRLVVVSAPSVYIQLRNLLVSFLFPFFFVSDPFPSSLVQRGLLCS
jgi:hypothetical protein